MNSTEESLKTITKGAGIVFIGIFISKLLTYIYPDNRGIGLAFHYMTHGQTGKLLNLSSRDYEYAKKLNAKFVWNVDFLKFGISFAIGKGMRA